MTPSTLRRQIAAIWLLLIAGSALPACAVAGPLVYGIVDDGDDGTEVHETWYESGYASGLDEIGRAFAKQFIAGLRFHVPDLEQGRVVKYARLRFPAQGGDVTSYAGLVIRGVAEDSPAQLSQERLPSALPKTDAAVEWEVLKDWKWPGSGLALFYSSPDIAPVINELLARPGWGSGTEGRTVILTVEDLDCPMAELNTLYFEDYGLFLRGRDTAILEVYTTVGDAFVAPPILGRPTQSSVTLNTMNLLSVDFYIDCGTEPGHYTFYTIPLLDLPPAEPVDLAVYGLVPDRRYYYRVRYREAGQGTYEAGPEATFHTQRAQSSEFVFTIQADAQIYDAIHDADRYERGCRLYEVCLANALADNPDFHIDMGDMASTELRDRNAWTAQEALDRYLTQRGFLGQLCHSAPFFFVLGNHEGEQGWRAANESDSLEVWSTRARKMVIPNPVADGFYTGGDDSTAGCGPRENYYAWEWGDALFVVLDPFWHTTTKPHNYFDDEYIGSENAWDWTLGRDQYDWLYDTLHESGARWKFVFCHHMTGGVHSGPLRTPYGRGGIEAASFPVAGLPSYEWGGENASGAYVFDVKRPGWSHGSVHDILVSGGVSIFFHGHDHCFVRQELDGVIYQTCPVPWDPDYTMGFFGESGYTHGVFHNNSGHLRVSVGPSDVRVDYVRAVLPEDEPLDDDGVPVYNGDVFYTYSLADAGIPGAETRAEPPRLLAPAPSPASGAVTLAFRIPAAGVVTVAVFDARGRLILDVLHYELPAGLHRVVWDGSDSSGRPAAPGVYYCRFEAGGHCETRKIVLLR
jgi:hypothetical protein